MDGITCWIRNVAGVHQALALGDLVHLETAREGLTEVLWLCALHRGVLGQGYRLLDPRQPPQEQPGNHPGYRAGDSLGWDGRAVHHGRCAAIGMGTRCLDASVTTVAPGNGGAEARDH